MKNQVGLRRFPRSSIVTSLRNFLKSHKMIDFLTKSFMNDFFFQSDPTFLFVTRFYEFSICDVRFLFFFYSK